METEELVNINISPLVTIPFAVQWSPDNQISVITEKGVHILALEPCPMSSNPSIKFARSFIYPSDILPAHAFVNEIDSLVWKLEREEVYSLLMEEAITPKLDGVSDTILRIVKVSWSPKNLISPNQCVLGILTAAGAVELLHKVSNEWYSICNVSSLRLNTVENEIRSTLINCNKTDNKYRVITENMRRLQACSITWSQLVELAGALFAYFCVAYRSGDILIWKILRISNFTEILQPVLISKINLNVAVKINVLCWISITMDEHLLVIGYFDGRIDGVKLKNSGNDLQVTSKGTYIEPDHIAISYLHQVSQDDSNVKVLATKGFFLLLLSIDRIGTLNSTQYLQVEGFNITGIIPITTQQFLITTQDSQILVVDIQSTNNLIGMDVKNCLSQTHIQYLGLAHSPNKIIFVNVTSPNTLYDHLVTREPSIIHIFTLKGEKWDPLSIINNSTQLTNIWDCMELLRLKAIKAEDSSTILHSIPEKFNSLSIYDLQISMWMSVIINVCKTKKTIPDMDHVRKSRMSQALPLIFIYSASMYLDNLENKPILSMDQKLSASLLRKYLAMCLAGDDNDNENIIHRRAREILNATVSDSIQIEKCDLCNKAVNELSWNVSSCSLGHKLPRCAMTLLQITSLEYRICPICNQMFHLCLEKIYEEPRCLFCDVPILYNVYAFDVKESELYGRNLSQPQISMAEASKEQNFEEPVEQQENNFPPISSVIVDNNDDNELNKITEKWEEF